MLISSTTPAAAIASGECRLGGKNDSVSLVQAQVKNAAASVSASAAATTRLMNVNGT
jgi:hypothetical protein